MDFKHKVILITGGTGKLGQHLALEYAKRGGKVVITSRSEDRAVKVSEQHSNIYPFECDLLNHDDIKRLNTYILRCFSTLDIIVNNAAVDINQPFLETSKKAFEKLMRTNTYGPYYVCKYLIHFMIKKNYGKIINVSSGLSERTVPRAMEYSMSKAALDSMTRSLAVEYGKYGISSNGVNISAMCGMLNKVDEIIQDRSMDENDYDDWKLPKERIPLERRGDFTEFVNVVLFLSSDMSNYVNGVNLAVDGGISARL